MADKAVPWPGVGGDPETEDMKRRKTSIWAKLPSAPDWELDIDDLINPFIPHSQLHKLPRPLSHWLGYRNEPQDEVGNLLVAFWACIGAFCGLIVCTAVFRFLKDVLSLHPPVIFASLGATAILDYNTIRSPLAQPRAAVMGHTLAVVTGVGLSKLFMLHSDYDSIKWIAGPLVCGVASAVMTLTNTVHPPGGATALLAAVDPTVIAMGWWFVPTILLGTVLMLLVALVVNNIQRQYPVFWWTGKEVGRRRKGDVESQSMKRMHSRASQRRRLSDASALLQLRDMIAVSPELVALPEGFTLAADEARALHSLQRRLALWTKQGGGVEASSSKETSAEDVSLEVTRIPTWGSANIQDPDVATVRGGSGVIDESAKDWFRHFHHEFRG